MELEAFINKSYKNSLPVELVCQVKLWGATSSAYIVWLYGGRDRSVLTWAARLFLFWGESCQPTDYKRN